VLYGEGGVAKPSEAIIPVQIATKRSGKDVVGRSNNRPDGA